MALTTGWTGRTACALQAALRLSNEAFAEHLGIGVRTVAGWHQKPTLRPKSEMQQLLDTAFERASPTVQERFAQLLTHSAQANTQPEPDDAASVAEPRLNADPNIGAALDWLDRHADWESGTARRRVASRLAQLDVHALRDRGHRRGRINQRRIAQALGEYYSDRTEIHGRYAVRYGGDGEATTSILTCPDWLDLDCPLIKPGIGKHSVVCDKIPCALELIQAFV